MTPEALAFDAASPPVAGNAAPTVAPAGLASLLAALRPSIEPEVLLPPPDLDAIRAAGWNEGFGAGEAAAEARLSPLRGQLAAAAAALDAACQIDIDQLRPLFVALVAQIAEAVLAAELVAGAAVLESLVSAALSQVRAGEPAVLHAHPETLAALQPLVPHLSTAADASLARDEFTVSAPRFLIAAGISARLAEITGAMA